MMSRSPSKLLVIALIMALLGGVAVAIIPHATADHSVDELEEEESQLEFRRSDNVIDIRPYNIPEITPDIQRQFTESFSIYPMPEERDNPPFISPTSPVNNQIRITICNGHIAGANFRSGPSQRSPQIGVISNGVMVQLTGKREGEYYEAIAPYWAGELYIQSGTAWIHQCWVN